MLMSAVTSAVTTSDAIWSTTTTQATAQPWQTQEQYQQYYNYYQSMSQVPVAAVTSAITDPTTTAAVAAYPQDYSKAWDEYYKAYYGQSYSVSAPPTQYPATAYNYDQYGYPNLAAPPPVYQYDATAAAPAATYQFSQPPPVAVTTTASYVYTDPSYTAPPTTSWSEPPPTYEQPAAYVQQPTYGKPPPSFEQSAAYSCSTTYDQSVPKPKETFVGASPGKNEAYMDKYPQSSFDSVDKQGSRSNNRGRGFNKGDERSPTDDNFRRPPRNNRFNQINKAPRGRGTFNDSNDRPSYNNEERPAFNNESPSQYNSYDQPQYGDNDCQVEGNTYRGGGAPFRGREGAPPFRGREGAPPFRGREGAPPFRGRGGDSSFRPRGGDSSFRPRGGDSSFRGRGDSFRGRGGFDGNNRRDSQSWSEPEDNFNKPECTWEEEISVKKESPWAMEEDDDTALPGWNNTPSKALLDVDKPKQPNNWPSNITNKAVSLMDVVVRPSNQSPIIARRQGLIDQWQSAVRDIVDRKINVQQYWTTLKSALAPEVQGMLSPYFIKGENNVTHCELVFDEIFLLHAKGNNEDGAIEEASKAMWKLLQNRLYVHTASRSCGLDKVPVFTVSRSITGPVSVAPYIRGVPANEQRVGAVTSHIAAGLEEARKKSLGHVDASPANQFPDSQDSNAVAAEHSDSAIAPCDSGLEPSYKDDDIFLVVDSGLNEKDQSIAILNNTAKFNKITIEYKHEKPANAPHISQCLITINGQEFEKSEARDYLFAKREAADKAVIIFKESCPQISVNLDRACDVIRDELMAGGRSVEEAAGEFLKQFVNCDEDDVHRFGQSFANDERDVVSRLASNLNLVTKQEGRGLLLVFKQYPLCDMKKRILRNGFCAQYRLVPCASGSKCT